MENKIIRANKDLDHNVMGLFAFINNMVTSIWTSKKVDNNILWFYDIVGNSPYYDKLIDYTNNVWEYYFFQPSGIKYSDMDLSLQTEYNDKYYNENIVKTYHVPNSIQDILQDIHDTVFKTSKNKIVIKPEIEYLIADTRKRLGLNSQKYISIHFRGNDFPGIGHYGKRIDYSEWFKMIDSELKDEYKIFLATDDDDAIMRFKEKYNNRLIYNSNVDRTVTEEIDNFLSLPNEMKYIYKSLALSKNRQQTPYECGLHAIVDSYLLSEGEIIIRTCSGLSFYSTILNPKIKIINIDIV